MKVVNSAVLAATNVGFSTAFNGGFALAPSQWKEVATQFPSVGSGNNYGWIGELPGVKKWVGPRQVNALKAYKYFLENEDWEDTIAVRRKDIEDDMEGVYTPMFTAMGRATGAAKDMLIFAALKAGFATECYDGQNFFDTDHPVINEAGDMVQVANTDGGGGEPWFLIDSKQPINPIILQMRKEAQFVAMDNPTDQRVFMNGEFMYGVDGRWAAGYGFWQWCWGSKQALDATHYKAARSGLTGMKADHGRPIGVMPDLLVTGPANEEAARKLLNSEYAAGGETNPWKGTARLLVVPWLA